MRSEDEETPEGLDLPRLVSAVWARKAWILGPTLAAFLAALAFVAVVKPQYTATAKVLLENGDSYFTRPEKAVPDAANVIDEMTVDSEAEAAKSPEVERQAMAKLKPADLDEFAGGGGLLSLFSSHEANPEDRRLEAFSKRVDIYPQTKTRVLLFEFSSADRARAARGANALAAAYLESQQQAKDAETRSASKWLSQQIDGLRAKVAAAESRVEALRAQSGLLAGASGLVVPAQQLSEIAAQIATARAAETAAAAKASSLREMVRNGRLEDVASVANDESLRRYAEARVALKAQIAELGRTLLPGHPRMKELAGQLAELEREIRAAAMKRVRGFEDDARIAETQVRSLQQAVTAQAKALTSGDADQVKLRELEIDAKTAREQLESFLTKYREAISREAENASPANGRIIAYALAPVTPTFPKTGPTLLLAPLAALFVSLGLIIAAIQFQVAPRARRPLRAASLPFGIDAAAAADAPASEAPLPAVREAPRREESARERQVWTSELESFVDRLADTSGGESLSLLVTGDGGALPAALVAARRLTRRGATALVDLGPSPPWLADLFDRERGGAVGVGLSDLAANAKARAAHRDLSTELDVIPSGSAETSPADVSAILEALGHAYAFVVVHAVKWDSRAVSRIAEDMAALLLVAPSAEISGLEAGARAAFKDQGLAIKAIGVGAREGSERAA